MTVGRGHEEYDDEYTAISDALDSLLEMVAGYPDDDLDYDGLHDAVTADIEGLNDLDHSGSRGFKLGPGGEVLVSWIDMTAREVKFT
jgi:hypothetical protein